MRYVQINPCTTDEYGGIERCVAGEAPEFFGVYVGEPGDFKWVADFNDVNAARAHARLIADGGAIIDNTLTYAYIPPEDSEGGLT